MKPGDLIDYIQASDMAANAKAAEAYYAMAKALTPGQSAPPRNVERVNPKTGEHKYFVETVYCTDIQGRAKRVSYISDRTRERKTQESLAQTLHMAQAANDAKTAFPSISPSGSLL